MMTITMWTIEDVCSRSSCFYQLNRNWFKCILMCIRLQTHPHAGGVPPTAPLQEWLSSYSFATASGVFYGPLLHHHPHFLFFFTLLVQNCVLLFLIFPFNPVLSFPLFLFLAFLYLLQLLLEGRPVAVTTHTQCLTTTEKKGKQREDACKQKTHGFCTGSG